jgi:1,4-dihydroxy-2-naphthoate octaprenyltransferase
MPEQSNLRIWLLAARPKTLWAGVVPVVVGGAIAVETGEFAALPFLFALAGSMLIQIGTNFANDLFDFLKNVDDGDRTGPMRVTQAGLVTPAQMKSAIIIVFTLALLVGIYLVWLGGVPILVIGLTSILFGVLYTAGPYPLGYHGLGDVFVMIFYGPVAVCGTYYVMTLDFGWNVVLCGLAPGMLSTAILTVNNLRDIESDTRTGKRTLAVRFGKAFARCQYAALVFGAALVPVAIYTLYGAHPWSMVAGVIALPAAFLVKKIASESSGQEMNRILSDTGKLLALYGLIFSIGWNI